MLSLSGTWGKMMRSKAILIFKLGSWSTLAGLCGALGGCGLGDVGPNLDRWRAEHGDAVGETANQDIELGDVGQGDAPSDTAASDTQDTEVAPDAAPDNEGNACDSPQDCPPPADCVVATCEAHSCGTKEQICEQDSNPCDQEQCLVGKCVHNPLSGQGCDDGSACTGPDVCKDGACAGPSLLDSQQVGNALFLGLIQPVQGHTLAWSWTGLVDLDGVWPAWQLPEGASVTTAAAVSATEILVFTSVKWPSLHAQVLRVTPATAQQLALPDGVLPTGTQFCNAARRLADNRVVALCSGWNSEGKEFATAVFLGLAGEPPRWVPVSDLQQPTMAAAVVGGEVWYALAIPDAVQLARVDVQAATAKLATYDQSQLSMITALSARPGGPVLAMGEKRLGDKPVGAAVLLDLAGKVIASPNNAGLQDYVVFAAHWQAGTWLTEGVPMQGGNQRRHEVLGPNLESLQAVIHAPDELVVAMADDGKGNLWLVGGVEQAPMHGRVWRVAATGEPTCSGVDCVKKPGSCVATGCDVAWCSSAGCQTKAVAEGPCDDGAPCAFGKTCSGGACLGGSVLACSDNLACTLDSCDPVQGCKHGPAQTGSPCDDGDVCFAADVCNAMGSCVPGNQPLQCDSPGLCQNSVCSHFLGCEFVEKAPGASCNGGVGVCAESQCWTPFASAIAAGPSHSCALRPDHSLWCWGSNADGQLLSVGLASAATATLTGSASYAAVAVGDGFTCGLDLSQNVWCWGRNDHGQTGGAGTKTLVPTQLSLPIAATQIAAGAVHACARGPDKAGVQRVYCWGAAAQGETGQGSGAVDSATPQEVPGMTGATWLASGEHTSCSVLGGKVYCWGAGGTAWLNGKAAPKPGAPNPVDSFTSYDQVWVRDAVGCGRVVGKSSGSLQCWGAGSNPLLLDISGIGFMVMDIWPMDQVTAVLGSDHVCTLRTESGQVSCHTTAAAAASWGTAGADTTFKIFKDLPVVSLSSGGDHLCAQMADGSVRCIGAGYPGGGTIAGTEAKAYTP